ncbi:MAG: hypothetical protein PHV34_17605 [Verrucomicrobiae bacterium]|nr:hypothetical protein [Verrucomicrobiae bacterium]
MPVDLVQAVFVGGEWAESLWSRFDNAGYATAVARMRNGFSHPHGRFTVRGGLEFIGEVKDSAKFTRGKRFQFSVQQSYLLEFGHEYIRVYKEQDGTTGRVAESKTVSGAANNGAGLIRLTVTGHGFADGCRVTVANVGGVSAATGDWVIAVIDANTIDLVGSTFSGTYTTGGTAAFLEIPSPYQEEDLRLLKFEQSADVLYIWHPSYARRKLTRTSHYNWTLSSIVTGASINPPTGLSAGGSGHTFAVTSISDSGSESEPSADVTGGYSNTLSWTAVADANEYSVYEKVDEIYKYIGRSASNSFAIPSSPSPDDDVTAPQFRDPFADDNNPGCGVIHGQRLYNFRTDNNPQSFFASVVGDFENHNISSPIQDTDAITADLDSGEVNEITWGASMEDLIIGTTAGEWRIYPGSQSDNITAATAQARVQSNWGCSHVQPLKIGRSLLFVDYTGQVVRDFFFQVVDASGNQGYDGNDYSILSNHFFEDNPILAWAWQGDRNSIIWAVLESGEWAGMTWLKEHAIHGWHKHWTDGEVEWVETVRGSDGRSWLTYFFVKRTINGQTKRYIERLHTELINDVEDFFGVDCGMTYDGSVDAVLTPGTGATVQASTGVAFETDSDVFASGDVNRKIVYRYQTTEDSKTVYKTALATITEFVSARKVTATINNPWPSLNAVAADAWRMTITTITGLGHLEGKEVLIVGDGGVQTATVSSAQVTPLSPVSLAHVGLSYYGEFMNLGFEVKTNAGSVQGKVRRVVGATLRFWKTAGAWVGPDETKVDKIKFRDREEYWEPVRLFSGDKKVNVRPGPLRQGQCYVKSVPGLPLSIDAIICSVEWGT